MLEVNLAFYHVIGDRQGVAFSSMACTDPDQTKSAKVLVDDCLVQYRELPAKSECGEKYGTIGFLTAVISKIRADARSLFSLIAGLKDLNMVQQLCGYCWMECNTEQMDSSSCGIVLQEQEGAI